MLRHLKKEIFGKAQEGAIEDGGSGTSLFREGVLVFIGDEIFNCEPVTILFDFKEANISF